MPKRPDLDERFSLRPRKGEDVLRRLLGDDGEPVEDDADEPSEDEDSE